MFYMFYIFDICAFSHFYIFTLPNTTRHYQTLPNTTKHYKQKLQTLHTSQTIHTLQTKQKLQTIHTSQTIHTLQTIHTSQTIRTLQTVHTLQAKKHYKQNETKQNRTEQNKTKQNKHIWTPTRVPCRLFGKDCDRRAPTQEPCMPRGGSSQITLAAQGLCIDMITFRQCDSRLISTRKFKACGCENAAIPRRDTNPGQLA